MSEWVSVEDKLPQEGIRVLVLEKVNRHSLIKIACFIVDEVPFKEGIWMDDSGDFFHKRYASHWQYLPELPHG